MLSFLGFVATILGLISLIRPLRRLGIRSRRNAAWVLAVGILATLISGANTPTEETAPIPLQSSPQGTPESADGALEQEPQQARDDAARPSEASANQDAQHTPRSEPTEAAAAAEPAPEKPPAGAAEEDEGLRPGVTQATVTRVVDGDTIDVEYLAGAELPATRVRLIGVDTPEVHGQTEAYGAEASAFTKEQLTGKTVWLERDVSDTDRYGWALRYVWLTEPPAEPTEDDVRQHMFSAILVL